MKEKSKIVPVEIVEMKMRNSQNASHSHLISFKNEAKLNEMRHITGLNNIRLNGKRLHIKCD